ncbi:hypothetical protein AYK26_07075 [Euryarchaeota archaeon SM23-78]|nr:MAG: hypothetical protein AYK26_07075 [Euryarchaeota archaeon SM23-78]MBW3000780.1 metal-dependent hydrolase [Candidatus Woesearchaeota archaeon]
MLGKDHLLIAAILSIPLLFRAIDYIPSSFFIVLFIFVGICIGSLLPDVDAPDAAINHPFIRGKHTGWSKYIAKLNPVVSKITRIFMRPVAWIMKNQIKNLDTSHRGAFHSLQGISLLSIFWTTFTAIVCLIVLLILKMNIFILMAFPVGLFIGSVIHLLEDSFTARGITWNYPKHFTLRGNVKTMSEYKAKQEDLKWKEKASFVLLYFLVTSIMIFLFVSSVWLTLLFLIIQIFLAFPIFSVKPHSNGS